MGSLALVLKDPGTVLSRKDDEQGGLRSLEIGGEGRVEVVRSAMDRAAFRLPDPIHAEGHVDPAGKFVPDVPTRFAVTHQDEITYVVEEYVIPLPM